MSAAIGTINAIISLIFRHVIDAWPERTEVAVAQDVFDCMTSSSPSKPVGMFLAAFGPRASLIFAKDPTVFDHLSLREYWDGMSEASQRTVWLALAQVYLLALAVTALPPVALGVIEETARSFADAVKHNRLDIRSITHAVTHTSSFSSKWSGL